MRLVVSALSFAIFFYILLILARVLFSWIMNSSPDWKPRGAVLVIVETCFAATDPPVRVIRHVVPPIRLGHTRVDLAPLALTLACYFLLYMLQFVPGG